MYSNSNPKATCNEFKYYFMFSCVLSNRCQSSFQQKQSSCGHWQILLSHFQYLEATSIHYQSIFLHCLSVAVCGITYVSIAKHSVIVLGYGMNTYYSVCSFMRGLAASMTWREIKNIVCTTDRTEGQIVACTSRETRLIFQNTTQLSETKHRLYTATILLISLMQNWWSSASALWQAIIVFVAKYGKAGA